MPVDPATDFVYEIDASKFTDRNGDDITIVLVPSTEHEWLQLNDWTLSGVIPDVDAIVDVTLYASDPYDEGTLVTFSLLIGDIPTNTAPVVSTFIPDYTYTFDESFSIQL